MKKRGFTITELLIAVAIIGVISAFMIPKIGNIMPDRNKVLVLKKYSMVSDTVNKMLDDSELYYSLTDNRATIPGDNPDADPVVNPTFGEPDCQGLNCTHLPLNHKYRDAQLYSGNALTKFVNLFADITGGTATVDNGVGNIQYNDNTTLVVNPLNGNATRFLPQADYSKVIFTMDLCLDSNACGDDDERFRFYIDRFGSVLGGDALTTGYIQDSMNIR